jgi:geranylgeranyl diphosphate synthase type 3
MQNYYLFCILEQLLELHRGQGMEIWFRDNFVCPTEEDYKSLVNKSNNLGSI